jgi:hypothetical protein
MEREVPNVKAKGLPRVFWACLVGAGLVAAGFADFPLIAYHFQKVNSVPKDWVPILYAVAMDGFEPEKARSLGLRLIRALSGQLRGEPFIATSSIGCSVKSGCN